jgi:uroporphyrinogen decarboxylase
VRTGLETITATTVRFVEAARERGIAGIFLAVQHASYRHLCDREYEEFGMPFDRRILEAADGLWLNVLHLHGTQLMFDLLADYPVQIFNWHDRETQPTLREGRRRVKGAVLGGLRQWETMVRGTPADVQAEARDAMEQAGYRRFVLGTGCVTPITAPWANLRAARQVAATAGHSDI